MRRRRIVAAAPLGDQDFLGVRVGSLLQARLFPLEPHEIVVRELLRIADEALDGRGRDICDGRRGQCWNILELVDEEASHELSSGRHLLIKGEGEAVTSADEDRCLPSCERSPIVPLVSSARPPAGVVLANGLDTQRITNATARMAEYELLL